MSADSFITLMRSRQALLYDTTVTIRRRTARGALDPVTATYATPTMSTIYTGDALVRPASGPTSSGKVNAGETSEIIDGFTVKLPEDTAVAIGDVIEVTASTHDAGLVGKFLRVESVTNDEWQIARLAQCVTETGTVT